MKCLLLIQTLILDLTSKSTPGSSAEHKQSCRRQAGLKGDIKKVKAKSIPVTEVNPRAKCREWAEDLTADETFKKQPGKAEQPSAEDKFTAPSQGLTPRLERAAATAQLPPGQCLQLTTCT